MPSSSSFSNPLSAKSSSHVILDSKNGSNASTTVSKKIENALFAEELKRCVLVPKSIIICYGPYMVEGILDYRTTRLEGLQKAFYKLGVDVTMKTAHHINLLKIYYMDKVIFSCNMTDLCHGGDGTLDAKCKSAVKVFNNLYAKAVQEIRRRRQTERNRLNEICRHCPCAEKQKRGNYRTLSTDRKSMLKTESIESVIEIRSTSTILDILAD